MADKPPRKRKRKVFPKIEQSKVSKDIKQGMKLPDDVYRKIKDELLEKYEVKSFQTLFDYLVISGIVYIKKDVIDIVRSRYAEYIKRYKQANLARLGKAEKPDRGKMTQVICMMYDRDLDSLNKFCIEENVKKFWIIDILMDEFYKENPVLIAHIKMCQKLNVTERKQQISRLLNDEYVAYLPERDAMKVLDLLTEKYDKQQFEGTFREELDIALSKAKKKEEEMKEVDDEFSKKLSKLRRARAMARVAITEPVIDDDNEP